MKKNILFISPGPTYNAHSPLFQSRYELLSGYFGGNILTTSSKSERFQIQNITYTSMKSDNSMISSLKFALFCVKYSIKLAKKSGKIDLVATYDPLKTGLIGCVVSRFLGVRFAPEVNGGYTSSTVWMDEGDYVSRKFKQLIAPRIMHYVLKRADGIKLLFPNQIDSFRKALSFKTVRNFSDYVPISEFTNRGEKKEVLFVGFPFKLKGVDILIKAFKRIASNYPNWKLKILGWFPDLTELEKEISGHPQIYHHAPVPYDEMPEHIGSCGIFVLPSRSEAMGRVLIEAMASGKARIGSNVGGISTVINDSVDGLLFESENVDDLADKLDLLMGNAALRRKLGKEGEIRAKREFSEEVYINNLVKFYNDVIEKS